MKGYSILSPEKHKKKEISDMTDRQQTGVWFIITGILLLSLWILSYTIVNWSITSGFFALNTSNFSNDQLYVIGASGVVALQLTSLTGVPLVITGLAQVITGAQKAKKSSKK